MQLRLESDIGVLDFSALGPTPLTGILLGCLITRDQHPKNAREATPLRTSIAFHIDISFPPFMGCLERGL